MLVIPEEAQRPPTTHVSSPKEPSVVNNQEADLDRDDGNASEDTEMF